MARCTVVAVVALVATCCPAFAQTGSSAALAEARRLYEDLKYEAALRMLDPLISSWQATAVRDAETRKDLAAALELRARARFGLGDTEGARADFTALVTLEPAHALPGRVNPRILAMFEDVRQRLTGRIQLKVAPADAAVDLDEHPLTVDPAGVSIPVLAGSHTVTATRRGYQAAVETFSVTAGGVHDLAIDLARVSAVVTLGTSPVGVEVIVDGKSRGRTEAGVLPEIFADWPARLGVAANAVSKPFVIDDLVAGEHRLELRLDCHEKIDRTVQIERLGDVVVGPFSLRRTVGTLSVVSTAGPASVFLDGERKGTSPLTIEGVCAGSHVVELRTDFGRYEERVALGSGDTITIQGAAKPVIALLDVAGLPEGYRGSDARLAIEKAFARSRRYTLLAPTPERVKQVLEVEALPPGWLSFDRWRRPLTSAATAITGQGRRDVSARVAKALEAQAVAELTLKPGGEGYYLALLAAGSGEPDVFDVALDQPSSLAAAISRLDRDVPLSQPSVGLTMADVADEPAPVVVGIDADGSATKAGIVAGDEIISAGEEPVKDVASFLAILGKRRSGERLAIEVKDRSGASRPVELQVSTSPRLVAIADQSWASNALLLFLRAALAQQPEGSDGLVTRLNLAVSLMRVGNYAEALDELGRVRLPPGPRISNGTVQYLAGLCHEALGAQAEAERAFRAASTLEGQLYDNGPAVKDLAERKLGKANPK
jgi:tetratricopeptide (TPR) repeat protein